MSKLLLATAVFATLLGGQAMAETQSTVVPARDVNFNSRADVQQLYVRLEGAAQKVCSTDSKNKYVAAPDRACVEAALERAVAQTNKPLLTAAYQGASGNAMATNDQ